MTTTPAVPSAGTYSLPPTAATSCGFEPPPVPYWSINASGAPPSTVMFSPLSRLTIITSSPTRRRNGSPPATPASALVCTARVATSMAVKTPVVAKSPDTA